MKLFKRKKWIVYLYYRNQLIKRIKVNDTFKPLEDIYVIKVYFKKHLFATWRTQIVCVAKSLKYTDEKRKKIHIEVELFEGV